MDDEQPHSVDLEKILRSDGPAGRSRCGGWTYFKRPDGSS